MSDFDTVLEEFVGDDDVLTDIRVVVRRLWFYDFIDHPIRVWQGQGKLFTVNDEAETHEWLGTINAAGTDIHRTPTVQDGRDGSSASYTFGLTIPTIPGETTRETYEALKEDQWRVSGRTLTCYLAIFKLDEALRPTTPIRYFKELTMLSPRFSEQVTSDANGMMIRNYTVSIIAKDGNKGRANIPNRTYSDANQKEYARQLGVTVDKGAEFLGRLANRTYQIP